MIIKGYIFSILYAFLCILGAVLLSKLKVQKKFTRKFVHILVGFEWVILYHFMGAGSVHFLAVCLIFLVLLTVEYKLRLVPAMASDGDNAPGTVYYAVAMTVMATVTVYLPDMVLPFGVAVFCTSLGDGLAAVIGQLIKKNNPEIIGGKTLFGTLTNLTVCFLTALTFNGIFKMGITPLACIAIALFATEIELFIGRGLDNIAITLGTSAITYSLVNAPFVYFYLAPILLTPLVVALAYKKRSLTSGGILAALLVDLAISLSLGNFGFTVLMVFFATSVAVDKLKNHYKKSKNLVDVSREKRGDCRDQVQVFANGGVASLCALVYFFFGEPVFVIAFAASLVEALADTVASGMGFFAKKVYDPIRLRPCEKGLSGGMSLVGTLSSLLAAVFLALVARAFGRIDWTDTLIVALCGFLGSVFDSFLGSTLQAKYKCKICFETVEREEHCGEKTERLSGSPLITNDAVNLLSTALSAVLASLAFIFLK